LRVSLHEAAEGFGARADDREAALHVVAPVGGARLAREQTFQTPGYRLDRRQRVVQLVAEHADEPAPRAEFFLAQFAREVGEDEQLVRLALRAEDAAAHAPAARAAGKLFLQRPRRRAVAQRAVAVRAVAVRRAV
jgi:hypothetical protein